MTIQEIRYLLQKYDLSPRREQGQNFLLDDSVIDTAVQAAKLTKEDTVLEIGPGLGMLTAALLNHAGKVIAVEQDKKLIPPLQQLQAVSPHLTLIRADIRKFPLQEAGCTDLQYKLVSNLPYSITSWVLRQFAEQHPRPSLMVVMVQKEVAERMTATPGSMSILSVAMQAFTEPEIIRVVPASAFYPQPQVDSALVRLTIRPQPFFTHPQHTMRVVRIGFSSKRKQLHNTLQAGLHIPAQDLSHILDACQISPAIRAQELSLEQWNTLALSLVEKFDYFHKESN